MNAREGFFRKLGGPRWTLPDVLLLSSVLLWLSAGTATAQTTASQEPASVVGEAPQQQERPVMDNQIFTHVFFDQLEGRTDGTDAALRWDGEGWIGTDANRLWLKSEGYVGGGTVSDGDQEALYDRPLPRLRYFDGQVGVREDLDSSPRRTWAALGIEGLAPHFFQFAPTFYFRDGGHVASRVTGYYDLLITQRLVAQPELEMNFYSKKDLARKLGTGLSDLDTGLRLRYEISRQFAPYVGFAYTREFGGTAELARQIGQNTVAPRFVFGIRVWR